MNLSSNFCSTELKFSFRASNPNGIMLYSANEPSQSNFIECHLEESKVACSFGAGGRILKYITPNATYSDGKWHTVCTTDTCQVKTHFRFITTILVKTSGALCLSCKENAIQVNPLLSGGETLVFMSVHCRLAANFIQRHMKKGRCLKTFWSGL